MHQNNIDDMDSKLRSMLRAAEVKPSAKVWKSIESRLDAASEPKRKGVWIWGFSLAGAAAALAAVLVFFNTGNSNRLYNSEDAVALTQKPEAAALPLSSETLLANEIPSAARAAVREKVAKSLESGMAADSEASSDRNAVIPAEEEPPISVEDPTVTEVPEISEVPAEPAERKSQHISTVLDPTAGMEDIDEPEFSSKNGQVRMTAKGSVGQNIGTGYIANRPMRAAASYSPVQNTTGIYETGSSTYGAPVTFGIGLNIPISKRISIGTGVDYSLLTRSFSGIYSELGTDGSQSVEGNIMHRMHYVGIPVDLNFTVYKNRYFNVYAFVGGEIEYCFSNTYTIRGGSSDLIYREPVKGFQFSTEAGAGVEARLNKHLGLFLAPAVHYYFMGKQPKSIRTEKQFMVGVSAGVRFDLKEKR